MRTAGLALLLVLSVPQPHARADETVPYSMSVPVSLADLAAAAGLERADPSTLPLDIVRLLFASPERTGDQLTGRRAAVQSVLGRNGGGGSRLPLPLNPGIWRKDILGSNVADDRLAAAIFSRRATALLYHGLFALDPPTLDWIGAHPNVLDILLKHPGLAATLARSIHVKDGAVVTPGDDGNDVWKEIVGADPRDPESFIAKLIGSREGRLAVFYDAVTHLDAARRRFALGRAGDPNRLDRLRILIEAATRDMPASGLELYPFMRPNVDMALLFRRLALNARDMPIGPEKQVWTGVFGEAWDAGPADAAWVAAFILRPGGLPAVRRDTYLFAQRALTSESFADSATSVAALQGFAKYPTLMLVLEANGVRSTVAYAAAARAAAALGGDDEALAVFQGTLAIVDRARQAGTLSRSESQSVIDSLVRAAAMRPARSALLRVLKNSLPSRWGGNTEAAVLSAMAGTPPAERVVLEWEGQWYSIDLAQAELRRLTSIRRSQQEKPLGEAIATATPDNMSALITSLTGLVYAIALGEPGSQASNGGPVWRRHRMVGPQAADSGPWRVANELFDSRGWHLTGSLLRLDLALAPLALRRIDQTDMPAGSVISLMDRRALARTIALMDPRLMTDDTRDAVAAALARGRRRVAALAAQPAALDAVAADAALSEWRLAGIRWLLAHDAARVPGAFTGLELFRLGGGKAAAEWGATSEPLDGCLCLRMPDLVPWEEYAGRSLSGQLGTQLADVMLRTADALSARGLPAILMRDVAAFAMQDTIDFGRMGYFDDWLSLAFAARDLKDDRFDDYVAALTAASGPLVPVPKK